MELRKAFLLLGQGGAQILAAAQGAEMPGEHVVPRAKPALPLQGLGQLGRHRLSGEGGLRQVLLRLRQGALRQIPGQQIPAQGGLPGRLLGIRQAEALLPQLGQSHLGAAQIPGGGSVDLQAGEQRQKLLLIGVLQPPGGGSGLPGRQLRLLLTLHKGQVGGDLRLQRGTLRGCLRLRDARILAPHEPYGDAGQAAYGKENKGQPPKGPGCAAQGQKDAHCRQQRGGGGRGGDGLQLCPAGGLVLGIEGVGGTLGGGGIRLGSCGVRALPGTAQGFLLALQGGALALHTAEGVLLRQGASGLGQQPCGFLLRLTGCRLRQAIGLHGFLPLPPLPQILLELQQLHLPLGQLQLLLGGPGLPQQLLPEVLLLPKIADLPLQGGNGAGAVVLAAAALLLQALIALGEGHILLPGGDEGGDALFQLRALGHGQAALADVGAALIDAQGHARQYFAGLPAREEGAGGGRGGIGAGKLAHGGAGPAGGAAEGVGLLSLPELHRPGHGGPGPGGEAHLVGVAAPAPEAVEHHPQELAPGGLAGLVGGIEDVQPRRQIQTGALELAEGGLQLREFHFSPHLRGVF